MPLAVARLDDEPVAPARDPPVHVDPPAPLAAGTQPQRLAATAPLGELPAALDEAALLPAHELRNLHVDPLEASTSAVARVPARADAAPRPVDRPPRDRAARSELVLATAAARTAAGRRVGRAVPAISAGISSPAAVIAAVRRCATIDQGGAPCVALVIEGADSHVTAEGKAQIERLRGPRRGRRRRLQRSRA